MSMLTKIMGLSPEVFTTITPLSSKSFQLTEWIDLTAASAPEEIVQTKVCYDFAMSVSLLDARTALHVGRNTRLLAKPFWIYFLQGSYRVTHQTDIQVVRKD